MPTEAAVQVELLRKFTVKDGSVDRKQYSFPSTAEFVGAAAEEGPAGLRLFIASESWRTYTFVIIDEPSLAVLPFVVTLPDVAIDGVQVGFPRIRVAPSSEEVCTVRQLM
jgi:hypothetical protein